MRRALQASPVRWSQVEKGRAAGPSKARARWTTASSSPQQLYCNASCTWVIVWLQQHKYRGNIFAPPGVVTTIYCMLYIDI